MHAKVTSKMFPFFSSFLSFFVQYSERGAADLTLNLRVSLLLISTFLRRLFARAKFPPPEMIITTYKMIFRGFRLFSSSGGAPVVDVATSSGIPAKALQSNGEKFPFSFREPKNCIQGEDEE